MSILRRILQVLLLVSTLLVGAAAAAIVISQTAWFRDWARGLIVSQANKYLDAELSIGKLGGNLFFGVELENLRVLQDGERVLEVRNAGVDYSLIQLVSGDLVIDDLRLDEPFVVLRREGGRLNLGELVKRQAQEGERTGPGRSVSIGEIGISNGTIVLGDGVVGTSGTAVPRRFDKVDASIGFTYEPVRYTVRIGHLAFRGQGPELALNALSGEVSQRDDDLYLEKIAVRTAESSLQVDGRVVDYLSRPSIELVASSDKFDVAEIARLVPALRGIALQPAFRVSANGPLDRLALDFSTRSSAGEASGQVTARLRGGAPRVQGRVHLARFDLAPLARTAAARSDITGMADVNLAFPGEEGGGPVVGTFDTRAGHVVIAGYEVRDVRARGRVDGLRVTLAAASAAAYGGRATAAGTIEPPTGRGRAATPLSLDLRGRVTGLDLRRLPRALRVPPAESALSFAYEVAGRPRRMSGQALLDRSALAGATLAQGTRASFTVEGQAVGYAAEGAVNGMDLQRIGRAFDIEALRHERFRSEMNGRFNVRGRGTSLPELTLDASADLVDTKLAAATLPRMAVEARLAGGDGSFMANGEFAGLDPGRLIGRPDLEGQVAGRVNAEAHVSSLAEPITPERVDASGEVSLGASKIGALSFDRARVSGEYQASVGRIRELVVEGPDVNAKASGTLALDASTSSNLRYHLDTPNLAPLGRLAGVEVQGAASVDGEVTGNRTELRTKGNLKGSNLGYSTTASALSTESAFEVRLPNLDAGRATLIADSRLAFVKAGGQEITRLNAKTTYSGKQLQFEADAQQVERQARLAGTVILHPDHRELHLARFGFATQGLEWTLAGGDAAIRYGGDQIGLKGVRLVSGGQQVEIEGTIGKNDSQLHASLADVDLSRLDTLIVGDRRLGGRLNATARVTGPRDALRVDGDFAVDNGSFRDFQYQTLGGRATYTAAGIELDVRLDQGPQTWLTARGNLPAALYRAPGGPGGPDPAAPVDFTIRSSSIDLGLVQGFTSAITEAKGTLQADVRVEGTAADPHASGYVEVSGGAFTVPPAGVSYEALDGRIALQKDKAVIERLGVTDEHGKRLTMAGDVAVHQRAVGAMNLSVSGDGFEVLHSDLGRAALDANLRIGGELRRLQVEGELTAAAGEVFLDELFKLTSGGSHATRPAPKGGQAAMLRPDGLAARDQELAARDDAVVPPRLAEGQPQAPAAPPQASGGLYDGMRFDVRLRVPDTVIVRGQDIRPTTSTPIGIGDVNVTLGGDVRARKEPGGDLNLVGEVRTVRGTYDFQGRRFEIQRGGRVRFEGLSPIDPALDIAAVRVISGVEARVHVGGTVSQPELTLTSQPPLDEADILSLIVFNQPANQLGEGQSVSLAQRASALATGFVASKLADSLGKALDLDIFEIEAAPEGAGQGAAVTVGEQLGQRLFVKVRQGVGATDNVSQFVMEYQFFDFLRLETTVSQGGPTTRSLLRRVEGTGLDLIFFFSY